jgi:hypothetical protein
MQTGKMTICFVSIAFCFISLAFVTPVKSEITELQALSFGTVVVISNTSPESFTIQKNGFINNSAGLRTMNNHQPAIFEVTDLNPNSFYNTTIDISTPSFTPQGGSAETFTLSISDFDSRVQANAQGVLQIRVGGTITTSGNGILNFESTNFQTQYNITVSR